MWDTICRWQRTWEVILQRNSPQTNNKKKLIPRVVKEEDAGVKGNEKAHSEGEMADRVCGAGPMEGIMSLLRMPETWRERLKQLPFSVISQPKLSEATWHQCLEEVAWVYQISMTSRKWFMDLTSSPFSLTSLENATVEPIVQGSFIQP